MAKSRSPDYKIHGQSLKAVHRKWKDLGIEGDTVATNAYVVALVKAYRKQPSDRLMREIWESTMPHVFFTWTHNRKKFFGYDLFDVLGEIYLEMPRALELFNVDGEIPWIMYFRQRFSFMLQKKHTAEALHKSRIEYVDLDELNEHCLLVSSLMSDPKSLYIMSK